MSINSREASEKFFSGQPEFNSVHGKTTYEWHADAYDIPVLRSDTWLHTSDIQIACRWHTNMYEWHTEDIRVKGWHTSACKWHTSDVRVHPNDIREYTKNEMLIAMKIIKLYKTFGVFKSKSSTLFVAKTLLKAVTNDFWLLGCSNSHSFLLEYSSVQKQGLVPKQFYRRPEWYILARLSTIFLFYLIHGEKTYLHCFLYENLSTFYI